MNETEDDIVEVYAAEDSAEAHLLRGLLEEQGIRVEVVGDALMTPVPLDMTPRIWVQRHDEARAREIVAEFEARQRTPHFDSEPRETWKCPTCGELVEADFDLCWNCQTPRKAY